MARRGLLLGGIALLAVAVIFVVAIWPKRNGWKPQTTMGFLGFTNVVAGAPATNALFGFSALPSSASWRAFEISQWDGTNWINAKPPALRFDPVFFANRLKDYSYLGSVPVVSTSMPTRVVIGLGPIPGKMGTLWNSFLQSTPVWRLSGRFPGIWAGGSARYFMTNEFNLSPAPESR